MGKCAFFDVSYLSDGDRKYIECTAWRAAQVELARGGPLQILRTWDADRLPGR